MLPKKFAFNLVVCLVIASIFASCKSTVKDTTAEAEKPVEPIVLIETDMGNIKVKLYNETPIHRDNFLKLVKEGFFDGVIFHRVINSFMVQGGDPDTKLELEKDKMYGSNDAGYKLPAEIKTNLFHKKGALAAARQGDKENPEKMSSGSQFYIVQGKVFSEEELSALAKRKNEALRESTLNNLIMEKANSMMDQGLNPDYNTLPAMLQDTLEIILSKIPAYAYPPEKVDFYKTVGGTPHLDGDYTVFGEVIEGIEVVDRIAGVETNRFDMPVKSIKMKMSVLEE